ncbi:MAG: sortase [Aeromicrobium sp.]|uniref:sortase domain-containing protein n=1 Tax=Aeromicrobium sp. TaxID=1871063 RepID=UPI0039E593FA
MAVIDAPEKPTPPKSRKAQRRRKKKPRRRSRVLTAIGMILVLAGLGCIGYVAWELYGTNIVAERKQDEAKSQIAEDWANNIDGDAIGLLRVPAWGSDYEMPILPTFSAETLTNGVGWYEKSAPPGEVGNFVIAGHVSGNGAVFRHLIELTAGAEVVIETRTHVYTYKLTDNGNDIRVPFTEGWPMFPVPDPNSRGVEPTERMITMITCAEMFHTDDRRVVRGVLDTVEEKPAAAEAPAA